MRRQRRLSGPKVRSMAGRVRGVLPQPARTGIRAVALGWGMATARWRQLPDVVVVGAQRSGTTTLFRMLSEHPELARPTLSKGTGYFDDGYRHGPRWYAAHFPLRVGLRWRGGGARVRTFECSGYYLFHPQAAQRIARDLPGVDVVVMLRDPVARALSAHGHERARGFEHLPFEQALAAEAGRLLGVEEQLAADSSSVSFEHRHHAYAGRSGYQRQIERLVQALGPDRVHVVEAERLFVDPVDEFNRLQARLGLTVHPTRVLTAWNAGGAADLDPMVASCLRKHFSSDDEYVSRLLGHEPIWREER